MYGPLESCNGLQTTERFSRRVTSLVHNRGRSRARGRNPNAGAHAEASYQPRSRRFWLGAAFCDFSEAVTGCGASPVAAVVVSAAAVVVAVLFTGFENAQSQRRPEKPRVASVHLRPRPVALPHLR